MTRSSIEKMLWFSLSPIVVTETVFSFPVLSNVTILFSKLYEGNLAVLDEEKLFDLWIVENNGKINVVAISEEHLDSMIVGREVSDGVWRSKGWWIFYLSVTEGNVLSVYVFAVWLFSVVKYREILPKELMYCFTENTFASDEKWCSRYKSVMLLCNRKSCVSLQEVLSSKQGKCFPLKLYFFNAVDP